METEILISTYTWKETEPFHVGIEVVVLFPGKPSKSHLKIFESKDPRLNKIQNFLVGKTLKSVYLGYNSSRHTFIALQRGK